MHAYKIIIYAHCAVPAMLTILAAPGCLPRIPTEKAFVVIKNNAPDSIQYTAILSGKWSTPATIKANDVDYFLDYETTGRDKDLPEYFTELKINTDSCEFEMARGDLEKYYVKNAEGRLGWDLSIDQGLLLTFGCKT